MEIDVAVFYGELRRIAARHFRRSGSHVIPQHSLIVHEAFLRLPVDGWNERKARVVDAGVLGAGIATPKRDGEFARTRLYRELTETPPGSVDQ